MALFGWKILIIYSAKLIFGCKIIKALVSTGKAFCWKESFSLEDLQTGGFSNEKNRTQFWFQLRTRINLWLIKVVVQIRSATFRRFGE